MADIYESKVFELVTEVAYVTSPYEQNVLPEVMKSKFDLMQRLAHECKVASELKAKKYEVTDDFFTWVEDLKIKYCVTKDSDTQERKLTKIIRHKNVDGVFYNIVYCILERFEVYRKHNCRKVPLSYDEFCKIIRKNRKTLSRKETIKYTTERIREIWLGKDDDKLNITEKARTETFRSIIIELFDTIKNRIILFNN